MVGCSGAEGEVAVGAGSSATTAKSSAGLEVDLVRDFLWNILAGCFFEEVACAVGLSEVMPC